MTGRFDRRITPARPDLAAERLRGLVEAERFVAGEPRQIAAAYADLRREPRADAALDTQLCHGESVLVFEEVEGWAWLQAERDGYVGYLVADALAAPAAAPFTHRVAVNRSFVFPAPDMKRPVLLALPLDARVGILDLAGGFARTGEGWMVASHLAELHRPCADFVAIAEGLLGAPYLWGGRTPDGIDCSGLVQLSLAMANVAIPRDSDMQAACGDPLDTEAAQASLHRGDLVFWPGHVGIMRDRSTLLHANAHHMLVASEPLGAAVARIREATRDEPRFRRIPLNRPPHSPRREGPNAAGSPGTSEGTL